MKVVIEKTKLTSEKEKMKEDKIRDRINKLPKVNMMLVVQEIKTLIDKMKEIVLMIWKVVMTWIMDQALHYQLEYEEEIRREVHKEMRKDAMRKEPNQKRT